MARPSSGGSTCGWIRAWRRATWICDSRATSRSPAIEPMGVRRSSAKRSMPRRTRSPIGVNNCWRGSGAPENPDILYDSISAAAPNEETVLGLQQKLLFMMNLLQGADGRPTTQAADAVKRLTALVPPLEQRLAQLR